MPQRVLKQVGRATTVLIKQFTQHFITLEINDEKHMINGWLKPARQYYQQQAIPMAAFELDLERMYPSIPRHRVKPAWKALLKRFKQFLLIHRNDDQCYVSVAKGGDRQLDCLGRRSNRYFDVYSFAEILDVLDFDVLYNDFFCMGEEIRAQVTGVAIGGYISAQNSGAVLMEAESNVPWGSVLPPEVKLCRFRDNMNCLCPGYTHSEACSRTYTTYR